MAEMRDIPVVVVGAKDLPVYCPNPSMPLWSSHPRVYLDVADEGEVLCPYCGTRYRLEGGTGGGHR
ncbi:MAG TPA: zinc-finger domain-containing protein [Casimicrobiaceae bacterium]|nr:zinc-finger domain-containing protein [Casimicrobiaceae bacterium]